MKTFSFQVDALTGEEYYEVYLRGQQLFADPLLNKGSHFTVNERASLGLVGLHPYGVSTLEQQVARTLESYRRKPDDLERYLFLLGLLNRNETLFYRLLTENLTEMLPIVYTPTVGQACLQLSHIMRRPRGVYVHPENIANIDQIFANVSLPQVRLIVVTDGERILGLGDLGSDGMGIPVGKISLYVAAGGIHPACCLPVCLDVGTNNQRLLADPLYLGIRKPRLEGEEYDRFIERFVVGVRRNFPDALLQWEDFAKHKAFKLMKRYRDRCLSFNDDIQGTGVTACAALLAAMRIKKSSVRGGALRHRRHRPGGHRHGARDPRGPARGRAARGRGPPPHLRGGHARAAGRGRPQARGRAEAVRAGARRGGGLDARRARPHRPQGRAAQREGHRADRLHRQARDVRRGDPAPDGGERPAAGDPRAVEPHRPSECTAEEALAATGGRALVATGSPFAPVRVGEREVAVAQCNNLYMFPGVGLGALVSQASKVTDRMFIRASKALAMMVTRGRAGEGPAPARHGGDPRGGVHGRARPWRSRRATPASAYCAATRSSAS